jgi:subtilisin family serine protease
MRANAHLNSVAKIDGVDDRVDVDVAIIDTGIDVDHPDPNVVASINCARFGGCASGGNDGNGHGTHVAGTVGALDNSVGVVGMAPGARLWAVRVLNNQGSGQLSWIIAGIDWVTARSATIDVANMSLGCECTSSGMNTAISNSVDSGIVYAVAAGITQRMPPPSARRITRMSSPSPRSPTSTAFRRRRGRNMPQRRRRHVCRLQQLRLNC